MKRLLLLLFIVLFSTMGLTSAMAAGSKEKEQSPSVQEKVKLRVPVWSDIEPYTLAIIEEFKKMNPNVEFDFWRTDAAEFRQQIFVQLAGGATIDVLTTQNNAVYADLATRGLLLPLDDMIAADKFDTSFLGPFFEGARVKGKIYGIPFNTTAWVIYYNKDIFDAAGVPYPTDGMTWDQWYELASRVTSGSGQKKVWGAYMHPWPITWMGQAVQKGVTVADQDLSAFKTAMEFRKRLENEEIAVPYFESISSKMHYSTAFYAGNVAMVPMGNWFMSMLWSARDQGKVKFKWDIVQMPVPAGVRPGTTWGMAGPMAIAANSRNSKTAFEFLKFYVSSSTSAEILAQYGLLSFKQTPRSRELLVERATKQGAPENAKILFDSVIYPEYPAISDVNFIVNTIFKEEADLYFAGEQSSDKALQNIRRRLQDSAKK